MLFGASLVYASFGALMAAMTVLVKPISESLSLSPFEMGTILGAWQFVYLVAAIPTGAMLDRFGIRPCLLIAGLLLAASSALRVFADSYVGLMVAVLIFGLGGPLISVGAPKLVSRWFVGAERGLAMGIYMSSTGVGALLATVLTNSVIMPAVGNDWHQAFQVYALVMLVGVVVWLVIASHPLSRLGNRTLSEGNDQFSFTAFRTLVANPQLRLTMLMAITMFFFMHSMHAWLPEILRYRGMSLVDASYWAGVPTLASIFAALIVTRLALPSRRISIILIVSVLAGASALCLRIDPLPVLIVTLVGIGIARSCLVPIALLIVMENEALGSNSMGAASGLFFTAGQIGGVLGPILCGLVITATGNYDAALYLMASVMVVLIGITVKLRRTT